MPLDLSQYGAKPLNKQSTGTLDLSQYGARTITKSISEQPEETNKVGEFVKSIVSAPATIIARPIQAVAELGGASSEDVNKVTKKLTGGLVAPVPENFKDVKKDVGRGIETVALGMPGVASGGAALGLGSSLEQGNDLFSKETALQTGGGIVAGKLLGLIGKPLLNATGKIVGKITPQIIKDVSSQGAKAIEEFATRHEILPKVASDLINTGANKLESIVNKPFEVSKNLVGDTLKNKYIESVRQDWIKPTTETKGFNKATEIYNNAKSRGNDLGKVLQENKINLQDNVENGNFNTKDTADLIRKDAMKISSDLIRPSLREYDMTVPPLDGKLVKEQAIKNIQGNKKITPENKLKLIKDIEEVPFESTYTREKLLDERILRDQNAKYSPVGDIATNREAIKNKAIADSARKILEKNTPKEIPIHDVQAEATKLYQAADYINELHGKKVPRSVLSKIASGTAKITGASLGINIGGGLGVEGLLPGVAGYHLGGLFERMFENMSNPVKSTFLNSVEKTEPEVFNSIRKYLGEQETARLMRKALPAPNYIPIGGSTDPTKYLGEKISKDYLLNNGSVKNPITQTTNNVAKNAIPNSIQQPKIKSKLPIKPPKLK